MIFTEKNFVSGFIENRDGKAEKEIIISALKEKYHLAEFYTVKQIHSTDVVVNQGSCEADGIIITGKGKGAAVFTADCVPVVIFDKAKEISGIFHSGWRGTFNGIVQSGIKMMKELGANELSAIIYPSIQNCCFEIGSELLKEFRSNGIEVEERNSRLYADLNSKLLNVMKSYNIAVVQNIKTCTCCTKQLFSYRQNKTAKRHFSWIANLP